MLDKKEIVKKVTAFCNRYEGGCANGEHCPLLDGHNCMIRSMSVGGYNGGVFTDFEDYVTDDELEEVLRKIGEKPEPHNDQSAKADSGKAQISLVPMNIVWAIAWIRMYGNRKYGDSENWKNVEPERYRDALMRHLLKYMEDPKSIDEESGYPHLWHAACNMAFLMSMEYGDRVYSGDTFGSLKWKEIGKTLRQSFNEGLSNETTDELVEGKYDDLIDYLSQFDESECVKVKYVRQKVEADLGKEINWYEKRR